VARGRRLLSHTADAGFEVWGDCLGDVYAESAVALFEVMGEPATLAPSAPVTVEASGVDRGDLLVRLLSELLVRFELDGLFVTGATCAAVETRPGGDVRAVLRCDGGRVDRDRETGLAAVKAVTYHGLAVEEEPGRARARVFVDV
jgi:SHS2 domain-containing protein